MKVKLFLASVLLLAGANLAAQEFQTAYFLDNYTFSYRLNPAAQAFEDDMNGFFGIGIDNINVAARTNTGVSNFLFPYDGKLVLGLNENITSEQFLGGLKPEISAMVNLNMNVFSFGGKTFNGTRTTGAWNFEVNLKSNDAVNIPKEVFSVLKDGTSAVQTVKTGSVHSRTYLEAAFGYSRKFLDDKLSVGLKAKFLVGLAGAQASVTSLDFVGPSGSIDVNGSFNADLAVNAIDFMDANGKFKDVTFAGVKPSGFGVGFDIGGVYKINDKIEVSAAVLDLGAISWDCSVTGNAVVNSSADNNEYVKFPTSAAKVSNPLPTTFNFAGRYKINDMFDAGAIATFKTGTFGWNEFRAGANFTPGKVFSMALSGGVNSYGGVFGFALNLVAGPINLFAGVDNLVTQFTPQFLPVNPLNTNITLGLVIRL